MAANGNLAHGILRGRSDRTEVDTCAKCESPLLSGKWSQNCDNINASEWNGLTIHCQYKYKYKMRSVIIIGTHAHCLICTID